MVTHWAFIYDKDGTLLMVCPITDLGRWWGAACMRRIEVRPLVHV